MKLKNLLNFSLFKIMKTILFLVYMRLLRPVHKITIRKVTGFCELERKALQNDYKGFCI